jgi:hypothetical protein
VQFIVTNLLIKPAAPVRNFDDIFHAKFMQIIQDWKNDPTRGQLTQKDRKTFIETAYFETDQLFFGRRPLGEHDIKLRALTKVFYKVLAEEPWSEDWIRAPDVERKLSKFEMHKDSVALAAQHNLHTPRDAVKAARDAANKHKVALKQAEKDGKSAKDLRILRGPFDEIEIIYIAGTVSSTATNKIDREHIYPVSVSSVADVLQNHICRDMVRPFTMAERFINCNNPEELEMFRKFACNVCDYCPHLLDNDNVSLLVVLLILSRSDCCRRFENNGIRIEGSTISHRKAECMKNKMGWKTAEEKKPYDNFATEFQNRVKNACFPAPRLRGPNIKKVPHPRNSMTPGTPNAYPSPHIGFMAPPQPQPRAMGSPRAMNAGVNVPGPAMQNMQAGGSAPQSTPPSARPSGSPAASPAAAQLTAPAASRAGSSAAEPMDLS